MTFETELRAALERATPGPWERDGRWWVVVPSENEDDFRMVADVSDGYDLLADSDEEIAGANASLIVLLRNRASGIAELVEAAREVMEATGNLGYVRGFPDRRDYAEAHDFARARYTAAWDALGAALAHLDTPTGETK